MRPVARRRLGNTRVRGTSTIAAGIGSTGPDLAWDRRRSGSVPPDPPPLTREGPVPVAGTGPCPRVPRRALGDGLPVPGLDAGTAGELVRQPDLAVRAGDAAGRV